jgi:hypothetical protein
MTVIHNYLVHLIDSSMALRQVAPNQALQRTRVVVGYLPWRSFRTAELSC